MKAEELRIKPSDLRLGNWVMYDSRYFQISMIADVFPELNTTEFGIGVVDYNNISAIPLTEEVLLKCGFDLKSVPYHAIKGNIVLVISNGIWYYKFSYTKVQYLHQLQNLFYSLTQTELEVSL